MYRKEQPGHSLKFLLEMHWNFGYWNFSSEKAIFGFGTKWFWRGEISDGNSHFIYFPAFWHCSASISCSQCGFYVSQKSCRFRTTWGWLNYRLCIFGHIFHCDIWNADKVTDIVSVTDKVTDKVCNLNFSTKHKTSVSKIPQICIVLLQD